MGDMASSEPDVKVHHQKDGCPIDKRRDQHTHTQDDWRAAVDKAGEDLMKRLGKS